MTRTAPVRQADLTAPAESLTYAEVPGDRRARRPARRRARPAPGVAYCWRNAIVQEEAIMYSNGNSFSGSQSSPAMPVADLARYPVPSWKFGTGGNQDRRP